MQKKNGLQEKIIHKSQNIKMLLIVRHFCRYNQKGWIHKLSVLFQNLFRQLQAIFQYLFSAL